MDFEAYKQALKEKFMNDPKLHMTDELWAEAMNKFAKETKKAFDEKMSVDAFAEELFIGIMFMRF